MDIDWNYKRDEIVEVISKMLDNPDEHGIYPTTNAYNQLIALCHQCYQEGVKHKPLNELFQN